MDFVQIIRNLLAIIEYVPNLTEDEIEVIIQAREAIRPVETPPHEGQAQAQAQEAQDMQEYYQTEMCTFCNQLMRECREDGDHSEEMRQIIRESGGW